MATSWRGAWRSRERVGGGDPVHPVHHPTNLVGQYGFNYCSNSTTASGTTLSSNTTYTTSSTSASYPDTGDGCGGGGGPVAAAAGRALSSALLLPHATATPTPADAEEVGGVFVSEQEKAKIRKHIRGLLLVHGSPESPGAAASDAIASSSISAQLDRWLTELRVGWVLHLAGLDGASARRAFVSRRLQYTAQSWTLALRAINRCVVCFTGWCSSSSQEHEDEEEGGGGWWPPASEFVGFVAVTFLQMLVFVDAAVAVDVVIDPSNDDDDDDDGDGHQRGGGAVASAHKFQTLADVRDALSGSSEHVELWHWHLCIRRSSSPDAAEATTIAGELSNLLSAKLEKMDAAIRGTRNHIRTRFMSQMHENDRSWATSLPGPKNNPSPGVHRATRSVVSYIIVLSISSSYTRSSVDPAAPAAVYGDEASSRGNKKDVIAGGGDENNQNSGNTSSCTDMIMVMIRSLEVKLARVSSQSFTDQSLRFLFLINNLYFVWHQLRTNRLLDEPTHALTRKIDGYINSYLQVSWTPVLEPLLDSSHTHTPSCCCFMGQHYSADAEAEHRFQKRFDKTYTAQKLWKVPDPELREELRAAITKKVISAFTKFLEDRNGSMSASRVIIVTPENLEEMLEELFEG